MSQGIEQYRAGFEAWLKTRPGYPFAGAFTNLMWESWKAAKSEASTEPVAYALLRNGKVEGVERTIQCARMWVDAEIAPLFIDEASGAAPIYQEKCGESGGYWQDVGEADYREWIEAECFDNVRIVYSRAPGDALDAARVVRLAKTLTENHGKTISNMYCDGEPIGRELIAAIATSTAQEKKP